MAESPGSMPKLPPLDSESTPAVLDRFAAEWAEVERHVPAEISATFGQPFMLSHPNREHAAAFLCADAQVFLDRDHIEEPNPMGSTDAVTVANWPREALVGAPRYIAVYSDGEIVG